MVKRRKKKTVWSKIIFTIVLSVASLVVLLLLLFHVRQMKIEGVVYSSKQEIIQWIRKDKLGTNGIYVWWKCKYSKEAKPPAIDKIDVKFKTPWTVSVKVKEKKPIGYIADGNKHVYFTQGGIAIYSTDQKIENVSHIEGIEWKNSKVKMGKKIPVTDEKIFDRIVEVSEILEKQKLKADRIVCKKGGINLYFSGVEVLLGKNEYDMKLAQLPPILKILKEKYAGLEGTLYLDHYETIEKGIRFVPIKKEETSNEETQPLEETTQMESGQTQEETQIVEEQIQEEPFENTEVIEYTTDQAEE